MLKPLYAWNVSEVANMEGMFEDAKLFDQPLGAGDVSRVENIT